MNQAPAHAVCAEITDSIEISNPILVEKMPLTRVDFSSPQYRQVRIGNPGANISRLNNGSWEIYSLEPLRPYPVTLTERLVAGANNRPNRLLVAKRGSNGEWEQIGYAPMLERVRALAQGLAKYNLSADRPIMILSGNDLELLNVCARRNVPRCALFNVTRSAKFVWSCPPLMLNSNSAAGEYSCPSI